MSPELAPKEKRLRERVRCPEKDDLSVDDLEELSDEPKGCPSILLQLPCSIAADLASWADVVKLVNETGVQAETHFH